MSCPNIYCDADLPAGAKGCPSCGLPLPGGKYLGRFEITGIRQPGPEVFSFQAFETAGGQPVEVRLMALADAKARKAFMQEVEALSRVESPGVQRVHEGLTEGLPGVVLDPVSGRASSELKPIAEPALIRIGVQLAEALQAIHQAKILHRAICPSHVRLDLKLGATLVGWGWDRLAPGGSTGLGSGGDEDYQAPELLSRKAVPQSDLYALGMTFIHLATGQELADLYDPDNRMYLWKGYADLSPDFEEILEDLTKAKVGDRLSSASRLLERLQALLPDESELEPEPEEAPKPARPKRRRFDLHRYRELAWPLALAAFLNPMPPCGENPPDKPPVQAAKHKARGMKAEDPLVASVQGKANQEPVLPKPMRLSDIPILSLGLKFLHLLPASWSVPPEAIAAGEPGQKPPAAGGGSQAKGVAGPHAGGSPGGSPKGAPGAGGGGAPAQAPGGGGSPSAKQQGNPAGDQQAGGSLKQQSNSPGDGGSPSGGGQAAAPGGTPADLASDPSGVEIHVSKKLHRMDIYRDSMLIQSYQVGLGANSSTPVGAFPIVSRAKQPDYKAPDGSITPGGLQNNPLGTRWMGLAVKGRTGIGIHGTTDPDSIGDDKSKGCIRMRNEDVENLYDQFHKIAKVIIEP